MLLKIMLERDFFFNVNELETIITSKIKWNNSDRASVSMAPEQQDYMTKNPQLEQTEIQGKRTK